MRRTFIIFMLLTGIVFSVLAQEVETRSLSDFRMISVGEAISVTLISGNKNEAVIKVDNIDLEDISTEVRGDRLKIELDGYRHRNIDVSITLTYKKIEEISVSSAADVVTQGPIKSQSIDISVSSAGYAKLEIDAEEIDVDVSSSGELLLSGKIISQRVDVSSAGVYRAYELDCDDAYIRASSAGSARVSSSKKIDAKANSAGSVKYKGNPDKVYVSSGSGGHAGKAY